MSLWKGLMSLLYGLIDLVVCRFFVFFFFFCCFLGVCVCVSVSDCLLLYLLLF